MYNDRINRISTGINNKLFGLSNTSNEPCIFKVHDRLRNHNEEAYEPQVLSIGPYHHGKCNLKKMETYKQRYLQKLLLRGGEKNADRYIIALMELEDRARRCYAEEISLSEDDFVEMLCLDGIFIIEFLRKRHMAGLRNGNDKFFEMGWLISTVVGDLILFENQIPFFVLAILFDMTKFPGQEDNLIDLALPLCHVPFDIGGSYTSISANEVIHLLDLLHKSWCSSFAAILNEINNPENDNEINDPENDFSLEIFNEINDPENDFLLELKSASQLRQSGIKFESVKQHGERAKQHGSWLHITFENGKIKIPHLTVEDSTESIFRNLIAFEQYMIDSQSWRFITDYATFLDDLIDSPRDVKKLRHCKIITNWLGDDEVVATMFNKLVRNIFINDKKFCYSGVYKEVKKHAEKRRNFWKAHLMRNYFNTPWSVISFLAAVMLLVLTFVQTIFSILAVGKN